MINEKNDDKNKDVNLQVYKLKS